MRHHRRGLFAAAALGALCLAQAGCQTTFPHPFSSSPRSQTTAADPTLQPGSSVAWSVTAPGQPRGGTSGRSYVQNDGKMEMGPFGSVAVAGLTVPRAQAAIAKQMRHYLREPKVELWVVQARPPALAAAPLQQVRVVQTAQAAARPEMQWSSDPAERPRVVSAARPPQPGGAVRLVSSQPAALAQGPVLIVGDGAQKKDTGPEPLPGAGSTKKKRPEELGQPQPLPGQAPGPLVAELGFPGADGHFGPGRPTPNECARVTLPPYIIAPPDILLIETIAGLKTQKVEGQHLVRPDGTVGLGIYGSVYVTGMTLEQARVALARAIYARVRTAKEPPTMKQIIESLNVDVLAYNSKVYYVITDGAGNGEQVNRLPFTGNETVLDAISLNPVRAGGVNGLSPVSSKHHIWVARPDCHGHEQVMPVDWIGITQHGQTATNYQIMPGDRVYVQADKLRTIYTAIDKFVAPIERILGVTLLGSETVNSIRSGGTSGSAVP